MLKRIGQIFSVILVCILLFSLPAFTYNDTSYKKPLAVINGGDKSFYPANSIMAIKSCIDLKADAVKLTVQKTSDDVLVLIDSDSTKNILTDDKGNQTNFIVSKTKYDTLNTLYLLGGNNNKQLSASKYKIATLNEAITITKGKIKVFLDCDSSILNNVYDVVANNDAIHDVIFTSNLEIDEFVKWAKDKDKKPNIMPYHKSNVIFVAKNHLSVAKKNNLEFVQFATNNQYGVIFSDFFMRRTKNINTYFSFTNSKASGKRPDSVEGWEDVLSRGYNIIESNNCHEILQYFELVKTNRKTLIKTIEAYEKIGTSPYSFVTVKKLNEAYQNAHMLLQDGTSNASKLSQANTSLNNAISSLEIDDHSIPTGKLAFTGARLFWMTFALLLFAAVNIYIFKKTKKQ